MSVFGTLRSSATDAARRAFLGLSRGTVLKADDKPKMQELEVRVRINDRWTNVEHWQGYGLSYVPLPPDKGGEAEVLIGFLGGDPSHPVAFAVADRRHRPKDMKPGDLAHYDHRGQITTYTKDGITKRSPLTITHETVDGDGKVTSTVVQQPDGTVTISNKHGASVVMNGANLRFKAGDGGSHSFDGDVSVTGGVAATKTVSGTDGVFSAGKGVLTA